MMWHPGIIALVSHLVAFVLSLLCSQNVLANSPLERGIKEYNAGHYLQAIGFLGEAEFTDFNNPILHYYLANSLAKTNQRLDAIKEYKIALALEPEGEIGKFCRIALNVLGDPERKVNDSKAPVRGPSVQLKSTNKGNEQLAASITKEGEALLCSHEARMHSQIVKLQEEERESIAEAMEEARKSSIDVTQVIADIQSETEKKVNRERANFERRKKEIRTMVKSRVASLLGRP